MHMVADHCQCITEISEAINKGTLRVPAVWSAIISEEFSEDNTIYWFRKLNERCL